MPFGGIGSDFDFLKSSQLLLPLQGTPKLHLGMPTQVQSLPDPSALVGPALLLLSPYLMINPKGEVNQLGLPAPLLSGCRL